MRGLRSTLALILVLAGLGAYIYFVMSKQDDSGPKLEKVFVGLDPAKVEEIRIKSESGEVTTVKKGSDGWQIVSKSYRYDLRE